MSKPKQVRVPRSVTRTRLLLNAFTQPMLVGTPRPTPALTPVPRRLTCRHAGAGTPTISVCRSRGTPTNQCTAQAVERGERAASPSSARRRSPALVGRIRSRSYSAFHSFTSDAAAAASPSNCGWICTFRWCGPVTLIYTLAAAQTRGSRSRGIPVALDLPGGLLRADNRQFTDLA